MDIVQLAKDWFKTNAWIKECETGDPEHPNELLFIRELGDGSAKVEWEDDEYLTTGNCILKVVNDVLMVNDSTEIFASMCQPDSCEAANDFFNRRGLRNDRYEIKATKGFMRAREILTDERGYLQDEKTSYIKFNTEDEYLEAIADVIYREMECKRKESPDIYDHISKDRILEALRNKETLENGHADRGYTMSVYFEDQQYIYYPGGDGPGTWNTEMHFDKRTDAYDIEKEKPAKGHYDRTRWAHYIAEKCDLSLCGEVDILHYLNTSQLNKVENIAKNGAFSKDELDSLRIALGICDSIIHNAILGPPDKDGFADKIGDTYIISLSDEESEKIGGFSSCPKHNTLEYTEYLDGRKELHINAGINEECLNEEEISLACNIVRTRLRINYTDQEITESVFGLNLEEEEEL